MEKVYVTMFIWRSDDVTDATFYVFKEKKAAFEKMRALIAEEMDEETSWCANAFDENGKPKDDGGRYDVYEAIDYWSVTDCWNDIFSTIFVREMEVQ